MAWWVWTCWIGAGLAGVLALGVLYVALVRDRSRGRRRCPKCWYDMAGVPGLRCPECGREARRERAFFRTRRRWGLAAAGVGLLAVAYAGWVTPEVVKVGKWWAAVPRPVLAVVVQFWDDDGMSLVRYCSPRDEQGGRRTKFERLLLARKCAAIVREPVSAAGFNYPGLSLGQVGFRGPMTVDFEDTRHGVALRVLESLGPEAWPAGRAMIERIDEFGFRSVFIDATGAVASHGGEVVAMLANMIDERKRLQPVLRILSAAGPGAAGAYPSVERLFMDSAEYDLARQAAQTMVRLGPRDRAERDLIDAVEHGARPQRIAGISGLERLGPETKAGSAQRPIDVLTRAAEDPKLKAPGPCVAAIAAFGPAAVPVLDKFVGGSDVDLAAEAAAALWRFGPDAAPAVPALTRALASTDLNLRNHASVALGMIGSDAEPARPVIEAMLTDPDPRMRDAAADALKMMRQTPRR